MGRPIGVKNGAAGLKPAGSPETNAEAKAQALILYGQGYSDAEVAKAIGCGRVTLWRWRTKDTTFSGQLSELRAERTLAAREGIGQLAVAAVDLIETVMRDETAPPAVRLKAAEIILQRAGIDGPPPEEKSVDVDAVARMLVECHPDAIERAQRLQ